MKEFILHLDEIEPQISPMTRTLYLWTKRGCARHAKMLNTEMAWQVFEMLEDAYFNPKENPLPSSELETKLDRPDKYIDMTADVNLRDNLINLVYHILIMN